ncbi:MAG: hypothetical protein IJV34_08545 [Prevotella sp.]|nr:hypothetical protein [Prevotella sp.]
MAKGNVWQDDYWLPLMQLYLRRPVGVKPTYSRGMVELGLELHVAPQVLAEKMQQIATLSTPRVERIWQTYSANPRRLQRAVRLWREMRGFGAESSFYDGVGVAETFERDFRPFDEEPRLTMVGLILILDLYFRLTPITMVAETPEVVELARLLKVDARLVVTVLELFQLCDPYLNRSGVSDSPLLQPCSEVWQRFGNGDTEQLAAFAQQLQEYYK